MTLASSNMQYEKAQMFKEKVDVLEGFQVKSLVVNQSLTDIDVITLISREEYAYVNYMIVKEGAVIFSKSVELKKKLEETDEELISYSFLELRVHGDSLSPSDEALAGSALRTCVTSTQSSAESW